jgi:hypothetical protein
MKNTGFQMAVSERVALSVISAIVLIVASYFEWR